MRVKFTETWHDYPDGDRRGRTVVYRGGRTYRVADDVWQRAVRSGKAQLLGETVDWGRPVPKLEPTDEPGVLGYGEIGEGLDRNHDAATE